MFKNDPALKILLTLVFIMSIFYGCTKIDISLEKQPKDITLQFFKLKGTESPAVIKVVEALKEQNALTDFIPGFAQKDGYAVWDKSIVQQPGRKTYNRNGEEGETAETLVFTPIVETDSNFVNGFFFSRIVGDSTELHLYRASDYDIFPFGETDSSLVTAELITTAILQLNGNIFGHRKYKLTDNRLFEKLRYDSNHTNKFRTIELDTIHNTGEISKKATGFICEVVPSGVCHCGSYCLDWWENCPICSMVYCLNINTGGGSPPPAPNWPPDPSPDPFPIPSPGEGGGGSSGSNTPPDNGDCSGLGNCRQSSLIVEGKVPCGGCGPGPVVVIYEEDENNDDVYGNNGLSGPYMCPNVFNNLQPQGIGSDVNRIKLWGIIADYNVGQYHIEFGMDIFLPTKLYSWGIADRAYSFAYFPELWLSDEIEERVDQAGQTYWHISTYAQKMMASRAIDNASLESHESSLQFPGGNNAYKSEFSAKFRKWIKRFMGSGYGNILHSPTSETINITYTLDRDLCD